MFISNWLIVFCLMIACRQNQPIHGKVMVSLIGPSCEIEEQHTQNATQTYIKKPAIRLF